MKKKTATFLLGVALILVCDAPCKDKLIRFDAPEGRIKFLYAHDAPVIALHNVRNANETFQSSGMTLYARNNGADGTGEGIYQCKHSDDKGKTWSDWLNRAFPRNASASKTWWNIGDKTVEGGSVTKYNLTTHGSFSISYSVQWSTEWGNYLEGRDLYEGKHGRTSKDVVEISKTIKVWQSSDPYPPLTEDGYRCWLVSGQWKLYRYYKQNNSWSYQYDLPATRY